MWRIFIVMVAVLFMGNGCAKKESAIPDAQSMDLDAFKLCFEHVLSVSPEYMGGSEPFVKLLSGLSRIDGDHSVCEGVPVKNEQIMLSTGEPVKIIRLKSDFRCPCRSVWYPYYLLNAGEGQSISVPHPNTPKDCSEVCPE